MAYDLTQSSEDQVGACSFPLNSDLDSSLLILQTLSPPRENQKSNMGSPERPRSPSAVLKRSFSTPDTARLQKQAAEDSQGQQSSAGEKKRNKLGYHRTSIACSMSDSLMGSVLPLVLIWSLKVIVDEEKFDVLRRQMSLTAASTAFG